MLEERCDILSPAALAEADAICFTSNGIVRANGELVMGAGVAKAFRDRFVSLSRMAGYAVQHWGNKCQLVDKLARGLDIPQDGFLSIVAFPTKHDWKNPSDLNLIVKSSHELMQLVSFYNWKRVLLPRPGCNLGGLDWLTEVKPAISKILDDRVVIVTR